MKKSRNVRCFEPDPDVGDLIAKAQEGGLKMAAIINESIRRCGADVIEEMAAKRLKTLQELSFEDPQVLLPGIMVAA